MRTTSRLTLLAALVLLPLAPTAHANPAAVVARLDAAPGNWGDTFALDALGGKVIAVHEEGGQREARVIDLASPGSVQARFDLAAVANPTTLALVHGGTQLFVTSRDEAGVEGFILNGDGKVARHFGPASDVALRGSVVGTLRADAGSADVELVNADTGALVAHRTFKLDGTGGLSGAGVAPGWKLLWWHAGYGQLVARKPGGYDKKLDRRLPDSEVTFDLATQKVVHEQAPQDFVEHARTLEERAAHPGADSFVSVTGDQGAVEVVTAGDARFLVARSEEPYDAASLQSQVVGDDLYFSVDIDYLNSPRRAAGQRAPMFLDVYRVNASARDARLVAHLPTEGNLLAWRVAAGRLAVLAKKPAFPRGGQVITVYALGTP